MSYSVKTIPQFDRQLKRLVKKYPSLKTEFIQLVELLKTNPKTGTPLQNNCFKIRISIASKRKGKSGGGRVITHLAFHNSIVFLLAIYDKSETANITEAELLVLLKPLLK